MHTQGKWSVVEKINHYVIEDKEQPYASPVAGQMTKDTANYIIQMHNSFDNLLGALKTIEILTNSSEGSKTALEETRIVIMATARQAIAKAEGSK